MSIRNRPRDVHSILLIMPSPIGDAIMTTPVAEALHARYPVAKMDVVGDPRTVPLMQACPYVDRLLSRAKKSGLKTRLAMIREIRQRRYDLILDMRTKILSWMLRGEQRFSRPRIGKHVIHEVEEHFKLALRSGCEGEIPNPRLWVGEAERAEAARLLQTLPGDRWLAISPGASWIGKRWPSRNYRDLARQLSSEFDGIVLLGNHSDEKNCDRIADALSTPHLNLGNRAGLMLTAALLEQMQLYIGNCSGLGHMAAAVGCPTFTLFGPTDPVRYRPWGPHANWIESPNGEMEGLTLEAVAEAALQTWAGLESPQQAA